MIRVIDRHNREQFARTFEDQFRFRHEVFVKERGWTDFDRDGRYEVDQYDNDNTIYFAAIDPDEQVRGCFRLYPSTLPHMLSEHFRQLIDGDVPMRPDVYEMTRISVHRNARGGGTYHELLAGLQEYCLDEGIIGATALIRLHRLAAVQLAGFDVKPLGLPQQVKDEQLLAVMFEINHASLNRVLEVAKLSGPVLERNIRRAERQIA